MGAELLAALPQAGLRALFVWLPMLPPDDLDAAQAAARRMSEPRAAHYWDQERHLSRSLAERVGMGVPFAWDVYLAYPRGPAQIERPAFWMHQLPGVTQAPRLDPASFRAQAERLLEE